MRKDESVTTTKEKIRAGQTLVARYKKQQYTCEVVEHDGRPCFVLPKGRVFKSPSAAGRAVTGTATNGYRFAKEGSSATSSALCETGPMSDESIERVLAELRREDSRLAEQAEAAIDWLSADEAFELSQYGLQQFLWYELPRKWIGPPGGEARLFNEVREGLAWVLARLGHERYAFMCRSTITEGVHAAYLQSGREGSRAFRRAMAGSGIEPPDLDDFTWGGLMGFEEASARDRVADALEAAVASGELAVGGRGWRSHQRRLAAAALDQPHPDRRGASWRRVILEERIEHWREASGGSELAALRRHAAPRLDSPIAAPDGVAEALEPLRWFLEAVGEGIRVTATGNLNPAFVLETARERGWWPSVGTPRGEDDIIEFIDLHDTARAMSAVRRKGRTLLCTATGRELIGKPVRLWERFVGILAQQPAFEATALEALALLLLERGSVAPKSLLIEDLAVLLAAEGYRSAPGGEAPSAEDLAWRLADPLRLLELFKMVIVSGESDERQLALTSVGQATLWALVRQRATGPLIWEGS